MRTYPCIVCGSPATNTLCDKCFLERNDLFAAPEKIILNKCPSCGLYHMKRASGEDLEDILLSLISSQSQIVKKSVGIKHDRAVFSCTGYVRPRNLRKEETKTSLLRITSKKCDNCTKLLGGYYEAVFQIRGPMKEKILSKAAGIAGNTALVRHNPDGYDVRFADKNRAESVSRLLKSFSIKRSYKLVGQKKGKKLYRNYYAIR